MIVPLDRWSAEAQDQKPIDTILYTPDVVNSPAGVDSGIRRAREVLSSISTRAVRTEARAKLDRLRLRDDTWRREHQDEPDYKPSQERVLDVNDIRKVSVAVLEAARESLVIGQA